MICEPPGPLRRRGSRLRLAAGGSGLHRAATRRGQCGGRLIYTRAKGHGGTYEYFVCRGRQQGTCTQPHQRVIAVEQAVEDHYRHVELVGWRRDAVRGYVRAYVAKLDETAAPERSRIAELVRGLDSQERKLLAAHYADRISAALFNEEQDRLRRERASAEKLQSELAVDHREVLARLDVALELTERLQAAYRLATPTVRRLLNQAIFKRIWIDKEAVNGVELAKPFDDLITISYFREIARKSPQREMAEQPSDTLAALGLIDPRNDETSTTVFSRGGSNVQTMVRRRGLEPPRGNPPTRPSTLRVYQFRHRRRAMASIGTRLTSVRSAL